MQTLSSQHSIPGVVSFEETENGLVFAKITSAACRAVLHLQGAHLTEWCPTDQQPVLFLSNRQTIARGKAIRGGIPIIFPWFGARTANEYSDRVDGPSHGFARTAEWQVTDSKVHNDDVVLTLTLRPDEIFRELGFVSFDLTYKLILGETLGLYLTVENRSSATFKFEEALHTYLSVGDARQIKICGLENTDYFDKTDGFKRKHQTENALILRGETDRPYVGTEATVEVVDPVWQRSILVSKQNSLTTVVWNPWTDLTAKLSDMNPDGWTQMVCIETANALDNAVTLEPGAQHTMTAQIAVKT